MRPAHSPPINVSFGSRRRYSPRSMAALPDRMGTDLQRLLYKSTWPGSTMHGGVKCKHSPLVQPALENHADAYLIVKSHRD
eukprot:2338298-Rhodomonas_salina.1